MRVRVGNTDAEGRMVMADVLCKFKEMVCTVNFKESIHSIKVGSDVINLFSCSTQLSCNFNC